MKQEPTSNKIQRLREFRQQAYECMRQARDAQMGLVDALLVDEMAKSVVELSLNPLFNRKWSSVYAALRDGQLNDQRLVRLYMKHVPEDERPLWALDASIWPRADAETLPERGYHHMASRVKNNKPVGIGHSYSTITVVPDQAGSWALPLRHERIAVGESAVRFGARQVSELATLSHERPIVTVDSAYTGPTWLKDTRKAAFDTLGRLRPNRCLYHRPGPYAGMGRLRADGETLNLRQPDTWHNPDEAVCLTDPKLGQIEISVWHRMHFKDARDREVTVIHVRRLDARGTRRCPIDLWLMYDGLRPFNLLEDWKLYLRRYTIEHWYRFIKNDLLWTAFAGTSLHNTQLWSWLVTLAYWQLWLARDIVSDQPRDWERRSVLSRHLTPGRVKRTFGGLMALIGTPACCPKPRGKSPGCPPGTKRPPRIRYPVVKMRQSAQSIAV
jgi:hypothetical protein